MAAGGCDNPGVVFRWLSGLETVVIVCLFFAFAAACLVAVGSMVWTIGRSGWVLVRVYLFKRRS